jgi:hypothetical protein
MIVESRTSNESTAIPVVGDGVSQAEPRAELSGAPGSTGPARRVTFLSSSRLPILLARCRECAVEMSAYSVL